MNDSLALELQSQLIEADGDLVKGKIFVAQVVDVQSSAGGNATQQRSKGDEASIPVSGETDKGVKILTTTQYKIFICSLHDSELEDEDLPWATPYWMNSFTGKTTIPSPRFEPGSFVYCFQDLKSRQWFIEAACPNQLERLPGADLTLEERCKAFSGFAKRNAVVPESSSATGRTSNADASSTTPTTPAKVANGAETQNTVPTTADEKQNAPREPGEDLVIPQACKDAARGAGFGLNNEITKLIKDIETFKRNNPLVKAKDVLGEVEEKVAAAAGTITNYLANLVQEMKAFILRKTSTVLNTVGNSLLPQSKRYIATDAAYAKGGVVDQLSCLFDKILQGLLNQVLQLLNSLISKLVNTAQCVVEGLVSNFLGQLLGQLTGMINGLLGSISGAIGQVISLTNEVLDFVVSILELLTCEPDPQCAGMEDYNFLEGPNTTETLNLKGIFDRAKGIMDTFTNLDFDLNVDNFEFEFDSKNAIKNTLTDCFAGPQECGPPTLRLVGGQGSGGLFNPVLSQSGELFGFQVIDPGTWSVAPKGKVVDGCGNGTGAIPGDIIIGDIPQDDLEGDAPKSVASIAIIRQPEDINTKKGTQVTFKVRAKIEPNDGKKQYRWYYSPDLGENFEYIQNSDDNELTVNATKAKDNYYYVCHIFDARKNVKKKKRAKSVKTNVVRLNLTDVTSPGDDDFKNLEPRVTLKINKDEITKNNTERAKVSWTVSGKNIRDVRLTEVRKYKTGKVKQALYQKPSKKKAAKSGYIYVCPPVETEYRIIATNAFGTAEAKETLKVKFIKNKCQFAIQHSLSKPEISDNGSDNARMFWNVRKRDEDDESFSVTGVSSPDYKGSLEVQPTTDTTYFVDIENKKGKQYSSVQLGVGATYLFPVRPTSGSAFFTHEAPSACATLDTYYIARDGSDSAQLKCVANGNGLRINSMQVRNLRDQRNLFNETFPGPSNPETLERTFTVQPKKDTNFQLTVATNIGVSTSIIKLDTKAVRNCGQIVVGPEDPEDDPGKPGKNCPPGFEYNEKQNKCVRKKIRDPWLPPPLFPPGIIQVPIVDPGKGYDPSLPGSSGGSGRVWKAKCETGIERVDGDWEVVGIGSAYTLYLGDTVYQPERNPVTLGVPNGNKRHDKNVISWEKLTKEEIEKQIPGSKVTGTPYRVKDMSGFDDSRGSEIFKEVNMLDIKPIGIKGKSVKEGIYFDMTEFDDFQDPDVTFIAAGRSSDEDNFHQVKVPEIGKFNEDAGRVIKKDIVGGRIYGPIESESRIAKFGQVEVEVEADVDATGWNGKGIYLDLLDKKGEAIEIDFTIADSNTYVNNAITIPQNTFKDQRKQSRTRTVTKKYAGGAIYGPLTKSGPGKLYIGGNGPASEYDDNSVMLASDLDGVGFFIDDPQGGNDPVLEVNEPAVMNFKFRTDDDPDDSGIAVRKVQILDPFQGNVVLAEFDYTGEVSKDYAKNVSFKNAGIYPMKFIRPGQNQRILIKEEGKQLFFRDNDGDDFNAGLWIENSKKTDTEFMRIDVSVGNFVELEKAPQVRGTIIEKQRGIVDLGKKVKSTMYLETETPSGKRYATGSEGEFEEDDVPKNNQRDVIRYYENTDSSRTLVVSNGKGTNLDMVLRVNKGVFKRYERSVRLWRFEFEYKEAKDLGFSDQDIRWHLEHVFKSGSKPYYDPENLIDEAMEKRLRDSTFGPLPQNFDNVKDMSDFDPREVGGKKSEALKEIERLRKEIKKVKEQEWKAPLLPKETRIKNLQDLIDKQKRKIDNAISFGYIRDYPYARSLGFSDTDIRYYLTEVYLQKYPTGTIGPRMKAKLMDPTFGVFSYNPTFKINVGRPNFFDCENDYPYAKSLGFGDIDIRYFLEYVYAGLVDQCMKEKLEDPNWGRPPEFFVEATSRGCPDPCEGVVCPEGQICKDGKCIPEDDPCADTTCPDGFKPQANDEGGCDCVPIAPSYPIIVTLCGIQIENPGFGYECDKDQIVVEPDKGVKIEYTCNDLGQLTSVEIIEPGIGFTEIPTITINTSTGNNAVLKPVFCFEEPEPKDPCDGVVCPEGQICVDGKCVDPCDGVVCPDGYVCENGVCVPGPCPPGKVFDEELKKCVPSSCPPGFALKDGECQEIVCPEGYSFDLNLNKCTPDECPEGQVRIDGVCVDDPCKGIICPDGYICKGGVCVPNPCEGVVCPPGFECINGKCVPIKRPIPPKTPVVRVVDCVGKIDPGTPPPGGGGTPPPGPGGKEPYAKPKKEVCD